MGVADQVEPENKIPLLLLIQLPPRHRALLDAHYTVIEAVTPQTRRSVVASTAAVADVRVVLTNGTTGLSADEMAALPRLELACALGAGHENIDSAAAAVRGIVVANGAGTNDDCVADHVFGLIITSVRGILRLDRQCRAGVWRDELPMPANVGGKRLGILGLGSIGQKVARRAAGFDMPVGYHNRRPRPETGHRHFDNLPALAAWCDVLVVCTPGGAGTRHLVNAEILAALGPQGTLINIARGSVVDTAALATALGAGTIAGAALDVYESEPRPPAELIGLDNVVLTPHIAGWSPESMDASVQRFLDNAAGHFSGRGVVTAVAA